MLFRVLTLVLRLMSAAGVLIGPGLIVREWREMVETCRRGE